MVDKVIKCTEILKVNAKISQRNIIESSRIGKLLKNIAFAD